MHRRPDFKERDLAWDALEAQWMRQLGAGGPDAEAAFKGLYTAYASLFSRRLTFLGVRPDELPDVLQKLWMDVTRAASRWNGETPVRSWLKGFPMTERTRYFSDRKRRLPGGADVPWHEIAEELEALLAEAAPARTRVTNADTATTTETARPLPTVTRRTVDAAEWRDFVRCVRGALARLEQDNAHLAQLLVLVHMEELSLAEAAALLGGDAKLAKSQVFSARRKIRPELQPCLELLPR